MTRRVSLVAAWLAILGAPLTLAAPALAIPRIGLLSAGTDPARPLRWGSFIETLRGLGYVEGQTVAFERRFGSGHREQTAALVGDLAKTRPDLVVVTGSQETELARTAMPTTPIVFVFHPDPVGAGAVQSLARPGGYVTGVTPMGLELVAKRIELARETFPGLKRLARLADPATPIEPGYRRATADAARVFGIRVLEAEADRPEALDTALASLVRQRPDMLYVPFLAPFSAGRLRIVDFCARQRLPCLFDVREFVDAGGLMSYGPSLSDLFRVAARLVDKILKGAKPADLPVEQPTKYELVINLKAARGLGLTIPPAVLARADEIIQ
jgi:putative tryptophan/tyrosine transport system substrate-binding protein